MNKATGKRQQVRRRYATERLAGDALAVIAEGATKGVFVARSAVTVERVCADYLASRHKLRTTSLSKLAYDLAPLRERHGGMAVQRLTKAHIDALVTDLPAGGTKTGKGRTRRPWSAVAVNKTVEAIAMVLADAQRLGVVT